MSGYRWDPVFRIVPRNGGETVYWLSDQLTDVGGHTKITLRYVEQMDVREDINRSLRPTVYGLRPEVEIECLITTMDDHIFLSEIESALLLPQHYNVFLSLDGGAVEREVVLGSVANPDPIRGKTIMGATFRLAVRCVDLIPRRPNMMADPGYGTEFLDNANVDSWASASVVNGYSGTTAGATDTLTVAQDNTWLHTSPGSSVSLTRSGGTDYLEFRSNSTRANYNSLKRNAWYRASAWARCNSVQFAFNIDITNPSVGESVLTDGRTWQNSGFLSTSEMLVPPRAATTGFQSYVGFFRLSDTFKMGHYIRFRTNCYYTGTIRIDDLSLYGPALRTGIATW